jgi:hypothetical protein
VTTYRHASAVKRIAEELIAEYHYDLEHLDIVYLFKDQSTTKNGKEVWATASKVGGRNAVLASAGRDSEFPQAPKDHEFFVLEVAENVWKILDEPQRRALVDHELCHFHVEENEDGTPKLGIRGHSLEEFRSIVERHGLWRADVELFAASLDRAVAGSVPDNPGALGEGNG